MTGLVVAPCSHEAALFACQHWHYSRTTPNQKLVKFGVWERQRFIGVVLYGDGANPNLGVPGVHTTPFEVCELVRIALDRHDSTVTRIMALSRQQLRTTNERLRLVMSYADPEQGHLGRIYQADNWVYLGMTEPADEYIVNGRRMHGRALRSTRSGHSAKNLPARNVLEWSRRVLDPNTQRVLGSSKHRYAYPLDRQIRRQLNRLAQPYPTSHLHADEGSTVIHPDSIGEGPVRPRASAQPS